MLRVPRQRAKKAARVGAAARRTRRPAAKPKSPRKVKVLFLCALGEQASLGRKLAFRNMLYKRGVLDQFALEHAGVLKVPRHMLKPMLLKYDYIVTCTDLAASRVGQVLQQGEKPRIHIREGARGSPYYNRLLKRIRKEKGVRNPPRRKKR